VTSGPLVLLLCYRNDDHDHDDILHEGIVLFRHLHWKIRSTKARTASFVECKERKNLFICLHLYIIYQILIETTIWNFDTSLYTP
jgi:hypothetical protein